MARANKIYGDLSYANVQPTYVGAPITELDSLGQKLEQDYNVSLEARDKLQMVAANMKLLDKDNPILQKAIGDIDSSLKQYEEKGNWEAAQLSIRDAAKNFATNPVLKAAAEDKQQYDAWQKNLIENKNILDSDKQFAIAKTKLTNTKQLEFDPETATFKNRLSTYSAPEFVDVNKRIRETIKDMNPSTKEAMFKAAQARGYYVQSSITELSEDKLKEVARDVVMGSEDAKSYLRFQTEKEDFNNRITVAPDGTPTLRDYDIPDLRNYGILDKDNNIVSAVTNNDGFRIFVDEKGNEFQENKDKIGQDKNGNIVLMNDKGQALTTLKQKTEKNNPILMYGKKDAEGNVLVPGLYNEDGTLNKDVAEAQVKERITQKNYNSYLDYASNFAYTKEDNKYIADWVAQENMRAANDRANIDYKNKLENQNVIDFYADSVLRTTQDGSPRTIPQGAAKGLFPEGTADLSKAVFAFGQNSVGGLTNEEQRLIPFAERIESLGKKGGFSKLLSGLAALGGAGGVNVENTEERQERDNEINALVKEIGLPKETILSYLKKYETMTNKEKDAVKTLGKIMQLPQAPVSLQNKDNVRHEDGKVFIGTIAKLNSQQLKLTGTEIENLNEVYGQKIISTTKTKGADNKPIDNYEIQLNVEHSPSPEASAAYNSAFGVKFNQGNLNYYNQVNQENKINSEVNGIKNTIIKNKITFDLPTDIFVPIKGENKSLNEVETEEYLKYFNIFSEGIEDAKNSAFMESPEYKDYANKISKLLYMAKQVHPELDLETYLSPKK